MNGREHYREAERCLDVAAQFARDDEDDTGEYDRMIAAATARALVHATLAVAARPVSES